MNDSVNWFFDCLSDLITVLVLLEPVIFWAWIRGKLEEKGTFIEVYKLGCLGIATAFVSICFLTCPLIASLFKDNDIVCKMMGILIAGTTVGVAAKRKLSIPWRSSIIVGVKFCLVHLLFMAIFLIGDVIGEV